MNTVRSSREPIGDPPQLTADLLSLRDVKATTKDIKDVPLPVDIMLITSRDCEFLACYTQMINPFRCYSEDVGYVYFDGERQQEKVSVALVRSNQGPGGTLVTVKNAATLLRPKAVICVGTCSALNPDKTKLGDVVISAKVHATTCDLTPCVSRRFLNVIKHAADGYNAPLKNPEAYEIKVHCDGDFLSLQEQVNNEGRREELAKSCPQATAMETGGEGIFTAAFDNQIEWLIVKGICDYADGAEGTAESWSNFASVMAASVAAHILSDPCVFRSWPNYGDEQSGLEGRVKRLKTDKKMEENQDTSTQISPEIARCDADIAYFAKKHDPCTRQWLFGDFDVWFSDPGTSRAYVLLGDAGVGKSVMAGALAQRTREAGHLGAAYFCRHDDGTRNDPRKLLESIAFELYGCDSEYNKKVGGDSSIRKMLANSELGVKELFTKLLEEPLATCSPCKPRKLVVIDALDETENKSREDFLDLINSFFPKLPEWLVFFITSRPEHMVQNRLEGYNPCIRLCAGDSEQQNFYKQQEEDIKKFLEKEVDFSRLPYTVEDITKMCKGLFLYAFYISQDLKRGTKIDQLDSHVPGDIGGFFLKNFQRVYKKLGEHLYRKLFGCVVAAPSPLPESFISFVLNKEKSDVKEFEVYDAVSLFLIRRTSDQTVVFLHSLIPEWLTNKNKSRELFIRKEMAIEYLKDVFFEILSLVYEEPQQALPFLEVDLQDYVSLLSVRFLCELSDEDSLQRIFRFVTCYRFLHKRIQLSASAMDTINLCNELNLLAARCLSSGEPQKRDFLQEMKELISDNVFELVACPNILQLCVSSSTTIRENLWSVPWPQGVVSGLFADGIRSSRNFAVTSDKKTVAGTDGRFLYFADAGTPEIAKRCFEITEEVVPEIAQISFTPDDKFLFFGRLDKWFSVERGCVENFLMFSGNSVVYDYAICCGGGFITVVTLNVYKLYECCVVDILALWAVLEIQVATKDETTVTFGRLSETISNIHTPLGGPTVRLLHYLGIDRKLYQTRETPVSYNETCSCCQRFKALADSKQESSLSEVRKLVIDLYPQIMTQQFWDFETGLPVLHDVFFYNVELPGFCHFLLPSDVEEWCSGHREAETICNIAVVNAVWALMRLAESQKNKDSDNGEDSQYGDSDGDEESEHNDFDDDEESEHSDSDDDEESEHSDSEGDEESEHSDSDDDEESEHGDSDGDEESEHGDSDGDEESEHGDSDGDEDSQYVDSD